jgi:hypothetical protein
VRDLLPPAGCHRFLNPSQALLQSFDQLSNVRAGTAIAFVGRFHVYSRCAGARGRRQRARERCRQTVALESRTIDA